MRADRPADGVVVYQPEAGFRYGSEAFWVAGFALERGMPERVADLGTGSGIIAALLAGRGCEAVGFDVQPEWHRYWERTTAETAGALTLVCRDVVDGVGTGFDLVVCNPPYFQKGTGPVAADPFRAAARHETSATLDDFVRAAVRTGAQRAVFVIPQARSEELAALAEEAGMSPARWVRVGRRLALIELDHEKRACDVESLDEGDSRVAGWYSAVGSRQASRSR